MTVDDFRQSLTAAGPPAELTLALTGLWWDAKGDWTRRTPTCIAKKAIRTTQVTGMVEQGSPFAENHSTPNGSPL